ncbi:MAG: hypothetical protein MPL62_05720 [Alphaproteobacteria bacterium]|nr:hypothetical protein [Alphaproteobacteria bacterium]
MERLQKMRPSGKSRGGGDVSRETSPPSPIVSRETIGAGDMWERVALPHIPRRGCRPAGDTP